MFPKLSVYYIMVQLTTVDKRTCLILVYEISVLSKLGSKVNNSSQSLLEIWSYKLGEGVEGVGEYIFLFMEDK